MRTPYRLAGPAFLLLALASLAVFAALAAASFGGEEEEAGIPALRHFAVIFDNGADHARGALRAGCLRAASEEDAVIEFAGPRFSDEAYQLSWLEAAVAAKVDGIAVQVPDAALFGPAIAEAVRRGIPVVTMESDAKDSGRAAFVGASNYEIGTRACALVAEARPAGARVVQILPEAGGAIPGNLKLAGFRDALKDRPGMSLAPVIPSRLGIFSAEEAARQILFERPDIGAIVCYSASDTIGVAQTLVEYNRVGSLAVVGFGDDPAIVGYVEKGVVAGTVVLDAGEMGYKAVQALAALARGERVSAYIEIGVAELDRAAAAELAAEVER